MPAPVRGLRADKLTGAARTDRAQTTGRENQAVRAERGRMEVLEMADERKTIRRYLVVGLVILLVVGLACYDLWMRVEHQFYGQGLHVAGMPKVGGKASSVGGGAGILGAFFPPPSKKGPSGEPSVTSTSRMPSPEASQRRLKLQHMMLDPSIMEAQSLLWKQVEDWVLSSLRPALPAGHSLSPN